MKSGNFGTLVTNAILVFYRIRKAIYYNIIVLSSRTDFIPTATSAEFSK